MNQMQMGQMGQMNPQLMQQSPFVMMGQPGNTIKLIMHVS